MNGPCAPPPTTAKISTATATPPQSTENASNDATAINEYDGLYGLGFLVYDKIK